MKKRLFILVALIAAAFTSTYAETYEVRRNPGSEEYFLDRKIQEAREKKLNSHNTYAGLITRFGYGFNYDAFTYGASILYHFEGSLGVTVGFDGYYIPHMYTEKSDGTLVRITDYGMPLWDLRAGLMLGKYVSIGGLCGKWMIDNPNIINMKENAWFVSNKESKVMYGGWITFLLPISKHLGLNLDFAVTNKTGFNVGAGVNVTIPVK